MRRVISLTWKEWRESQALLWIGLGIFVGLPLIAGVEAKYLPPHRFEFDAWPWVSSLGGVLAVFVAAGAVCVDLRQGVHEFWRSRPVGVLAWLLVKYLVGLAIVLASCLVPLIIDGWLNPRGEARNLILPQASLCVGVYGLAFLAACIVRRTAQAGMVGLAAMLLVYFLPMVCRPLAGLTVADAAGAADIFDRRLIGFAGGMLAIAAVSAGVALAAVVRGWHIESGRTMVYGSISAALLIIVASAGARMGTDLPVLQMVPLKPLEWVGGMRLIDDRVVFYIYSPSGHSETYCVSAKAPAIELQRPDQADRVRWSIGHDGSFVERGGFCYCLEAWDFTSAVWKWKLASWNLATGEYRQWPIRVELAEGLQPTFCLSGERLYLMGDRLTVCDVSNSSSPRLISSSAWSYRPRPVELGDDPLEIELPPVPELTRQERLETALRNEPAFDGKILCGLRSSGSPELFEYRLARLDEHVATFQMVGKFQWTILEGLVSSGWYERLKMENGLLYVSQGVGSYANYRGVFHVFDTGGRHPLRPVGHFAAIGASEICPLPDGRALVGGGKLWLVGAPPRHDQQ